MGSPSAGLGAVAGVDLEVRGLDGEPDLAAGIEGQFGDRGGGDVDQGGWLAVEIGTLGESVLVRSSADPDGECVTLSRGEWRVFVAGIKDGDFDDL